MGVESIEAQFAGAVLITDGSGRVTAMSPSLAARFDVDPSSVVGASLDSMTVSPADRENAAAGDRVRLILRSRSGIPVGVSFRQAVVEGEHDLVVLVEDGTHRPIDEMYRELFERSHDAILIFEPATERVLEANERAAQLYGVTREELRSMSLEQFSTDSIVGKKRISELLTTRSPMNFETTQVRSDGSTMALDVNASLVTYRGRDAILSVNRDVTKRRFAEKTLRENDRRLRQQNRALVALARQESIHSGDLANAMSAIAEAAAAMLDVDRVGVWRFNADRTRLICADVFEVASGVHSIDADATQDDSPKYFAALDTERCIAATDAASDPRTAEFAERYFLPQNVRSTLDAPIRRGGKTVGVLCCESIDRRREWTLDEEVFGGSLADVVAFAMEAAERREADKKLRRRVGYEQLITSISTEFINLNPLEVDNAITRALQRIGEFEQADRAYLFAFSKDQRSASNTHEWCAEGIDPQIENLRSVSSTEIGWYVDQILRRQAVTIQSVAAMPIEGEAERVMFEQQGILSLVGVPVVSAGAVRGFVGFDAVREERNWSDDAPSLLKIAGEIFATALDRKRASEDLVQSELRFRTLIERMNEGVVQVDRNDVVTFVNARFCELTGYSAADIVGRQMEEFLANDSSRDVMRAKAELRLRGVSDRYEVKFRTREGSVRWFEVSGAPVTDASGAMTGTIGVLADITERRLANDELKNSVSLLSSTLDSTADGIAVTSLNERIVAYNQRFLDLWRLEEDDVNESRETETQRHVALQVADGEQFLRRLRQINEAIFEDSFDVIDFKDGRVYERSSRPRIIDGVPIGRVWSVRDVSDRVRTELALRESESRYRLLFERNLAGVYRNSYDGQILDANEACARIFGYKTREDLLSHSVGDFYFDIEERARIMARLLERGTLTNVEVCLKRKDGSPIWVLENMSVLRDDEGRPSILEGTLIDITHRKRAEEALRESEERYRIMAEQSSDIISRHVPDGMILYASPAAFNLLGYRPEELVGREFFELMHPDDAAQIAPTYIITAREAEDAWKITYRIRRKDGEYVWFETTSRPMRSSESGEVMELLAISRDVTERKHAEQQIEYQAFHDALTGLPNRLLFTDRLAISLVHAKRADSRVAVAFLDLDQFKFVNDTLGHSVGDQLLIEVARRLRLTLREEDTIARLGGDEFTILLSGLATATDARRIAQKLLAAVADPIVIDSHELHVTTSIGIAVYPDDGEDAETLLKNADAAMYQAKELGRNNFQLCSPALNRRPTERLAVEQSLRRAIEKEEFLLHYLPQVDLESGRITTIEALIRWQHPERGLVLPGEFFAIAEEARLSIQLGEWVLRTAATQLKAWHREGFDWLKLSVNLSTRQFQHRNLVRVVSRVLREADLAGEFLEIEIGEASALQSSDWAMATMRELKSMGVSIVIDDFGSGSSSFSYLRKFPFDAVKIDRSFIHGMLEHEQDAAIVAAVITLGRGLRLRVVAEGVETPEQLVYLQQSRCEAMQGFFFSKPLPAGSVADLLKSSRR